MDVTHNDCRYIHIAFSFDSFVFFVLSGTCKRHILAQPSRATEMRPTDNAGCRGFQMLTWVKGS